MFHVNPLPAEDSHKISSLIFSEKQWKSIYKYCLLQSWLAFKVNNVEQTLKALEKKLLLQNFWNNL